MEATKTRKRVWIIGLDGATFDLIEPWIAAGHLPNLAALIKTGTSGRLGSTIQPITAPAWTTFITGVNQGKHGLYNFVQRRPDSYQMEVTNGSHNHAATIFDIASQHGYRVAAVNVPYTFPPRPVNGVMVAGPFTPVVSPQLVHPPEFYATLQAIAPDYFVMPDYDSSHADPLSDYAKKLLLDIELRERLSLHLLQQEPWDLFMVVFMATDEVHHAFWHCLEAQPGDPAYQHREVIRQVYERADQAIGRMLAQLTPEQRAQTNIFVLSDHGGGSLKYMINFNRWLADEMGLLQFVAGKGQLLTQLKARFVKWAARAYRVYTPPRWRAALRNRLGASKFDQVRAGVESTLLSGSIDWSHTRAYAMGAGGNLFINLRGREPEGIVQPGEEYEALRQRIADQLMELRSPESGERIVARVYRREELFSGPYLDKAPDLLVEWADYHFWGRGRYDSRAPVFEAQHQLDLTTMPLTGTHRPDGILIAQGPGIRPAACLAGTSLVDLAPTLLGSLSIAPPADMDGQVLAGLLTPAEFERISALVTDLDIATQNAEMQYDAEEAEIIAEHLRSLGYL